MSLKNINFGYIINDMFAYLNGIVTERNYNNSSLILELNNIGYLIFSNTKTLGQVTKGQKLSVQIHTQSKDDGIRLWGFISRAEKELFECLISVSGVGPKAALNILNVLNVEEIISAVLREKHELLCVAPGVGQKSAKRIILELKTKLANIKHSEVLENDSNYDSAEDVNSILSNLGFSAIDIDKKLSLAREQGISDEAELLVRFCMAN